MSTSLDRCVGTQSRATPLRWCLHGKHQQQRRESFIISSITGLYQRNLLLQKMNKLCQAIRKNCSYYSNDTINPIGSKRKKRKEKRKTIPLTEATYIEI